MPNGKLCDEKWLVSVMVVDGLNLNGQYMLCEARNDECKNVYVTHLTNSSILPDFKSDYSLFTDLKLIFF